MIPEFVLEWERRKEEIRAGFSKQPPDEYADIVKVVVQALRTAYGESEYDNLDSSRIHEIDDGDYQGTLVFVIGAGGYQPSDYWFVKVGYGSCSGCDTLEDIKMSSYGDSPTSQQVEDYVTLALHIVQGLKKLCGEEV